MALAPTSFRLNNCPCAHIPDNYLIKLLIAAENWRKWLCKYIFFHPDSSVSHADESGKHETLILFQEGLQRNYFFGSGFLAIWGPFFACLLISFYFPPWLCNTYCAGFFHLHYASKQMWRLLQMGVLVYLHENTETSWYRDSAFSLICLNVDIILRTWLPSLEILLTIMNNNIPQFSKITPLIKRNVAWSSPEAIRWQTEVASKT